MKHLYALACALLVGATAFAQSYEGRRLPGQPLGNEQLSVSPVAAQASTKSVTIGLTPASRADESINFSPASSPYTALGPNGATAGYRVAMAFEFTAENATMYAGNKISGISFATGVDASNEETAVCNIKNYTVFLTYDLEGTPFYTQSTTIDNPEAFSTYMVDLDTPYEIVADKPVYVGMYCELTSGNDYALVVDYMVHDTTEGGWAAWAAPGEDFTWQNIAEAYGFVCVGAKISGDNLPQNTVGVPYLEVPSIGYAGKPFDFIFAIQNLAANIVKSVEYTYTIGEDAPVTNTFELPDTLQLPYGYGLYIRVSDVVYNQSSSDVKVKIQVDKVNGEPNNWKGEAPEASMAVIPQGAGFKQNVVVEEFTGVWCGWCVRGYSIMEELRENYRDSGIIPLCVHGPDQANDPMYAGTFAQLLSTVEGYPSGLANRKASLSMSTVDDVLETVAVLQADPAIAQLEISAEVGQETTGFKRKKYTVNVKTTFALDIAEANKTYALSFAISEDGVGPEIQHNYYADPAYGAYDEYWSNQPEWVELIYNDVARQLNTYSGINNSIPANVVAGQTYEFSYSNNLISAIKSLDNINIIAYLINRKTGEVVNAAMLRSNEIAGNNGVEDITVSEADNDAPVEFFNLQGQPVANPEGGIFIRRQGSSVSKVAL